MRFHSRYRLSFRLSSNCSIVTPSAPAAPPLLFTFSHAAQISRLGMSCDLPDTIGSLMRLLPSGWSHQSARTAPPLRSPTHCDTQADHSYYGRVRQRAQPTPVLCPSRFLPLGGLPHHPGHSDGGFGARLRTFRTRAQIEIMLPVCRTPPGQYTGIPQAHPETEWLPRF